LPNTPVVLVATGVLGLFATLARAQSPTQDQLVDIGRKMFADPALSASGQLACSNCHVPKYAYGPAPGNAIPQGGSHMNLPGTRAVPSLRYLQHVPPFAEQYHFVDGDVGPGGGYTWDGRAPTLHDQARLPLLATNEMANGTAAGVVKRLAHTAYAQEFRAAFGADVFKDPQKAFAGAVAALEAFQHVPAEFFPYSSKYDAFLRGDVDLTEQEERGAAIFKDPAKGNCAACHLTGIRNEVFPTFSDYDYMNAGVPRNQAIAANADPGYYDLGLYGPARTDFAGRKEYCGFFRAPTLRNVALRDAFFHNGVFHSLREVIEFYVYRDIQPQKWYPHNPDGTVHKFDDLPPECPNNIDRDPPLDRNPGDKPALTDAEIDDLIAFLHTLTDGYVPPTAAAERAWKEFVAVNRPSGWESWVNVKDVFLLGGGDPGAWKTHPLATELASARFDTGMFGAEVPARHIVNGVMVAFDPIATAKHLNETRLNRAAFEYIRTNELYNLDGQLKKLRRGEAPDFPADSIQVKAQWRPIADNERPRFHTVTVKLDDGTTRLYGMTALHIVAKDSGTWFWATFEQSDDCRNNLGASWSHYCLKGTMSRPVDDQGHPILLANSYLESGVEHSASCITCHARASIGVIDGKVSRLPVLNTSAAPLGGDASRGYVGSPDEAWFGNGRFLPLDSVWSLAKAQPRSASR
jgi:cytochrome c peroxidase